ncbi:MAG: CDP-alcohol phosphatidyltransferase family protein [Carboxylicivirga sp.]|jgi:CDP-diacylglycerol--serine O-phosphatidyltransferase|nr:CDP-alcohol phosphatidyltransferase family protein [Carboxylicivirga sp.]MCT4647038.1 CDP-alcohol phosphatidyltransferase family protein [Carboxylicivirga sp.]
MNIKQHIPNFLTCLNVLCGALAIFFAIQARIDIAIWLIFAASVLDFGDGFAARALKAYSEIGKEMDSLADLISFGVAPAAIWSSIAKFQFTGDFTTDFNTLPLVQQILILAPFVMVAFAALRLAKFNVDTRQTENFLGLTTTATGIFTASLAYKFLQTPEWFNWLSPAVILIFVAFFCIMLVSEVPMFSLKVKNMKWADNKERFILLAIAIAAVSLFGFGGIAVVILYYIVVSIAKWLLGIKS